MDELKPLKMKVYHVDDKNYGPKGCAGVHEGFEKYKEDTDNTEAEYCPVQYPCQFYDKLVSDLNNPAERPDAAVVISDNQIADGGGLRETIRYLQKTAAKYGEAVKKVLEFFEKQPENIELWGEKYDWGQLWGIDYGGFSLHAVINILKHLREQLPPIIKLNLASSISTDLNKKKNLMEVGWSKLDRTDADIDSGHIRSFLTRAHQDFQNAQSA